MRHRRWHTKEADASIHAEQVGGVARYLTVPERPPEHRHQGFYVDWATPGEGASDVEWLPAHAFTPSGARVTPDAPNPVSRSDAS